MTAATPYLRMHNITKKFGNFTALRNISLEIEEGEFVCFLGPSGCGKTTLLRAIAGLDIQTSGAIWQNGQDISALPPAERDFGIVFQSYALFPNLSVRKNIAYGLENRGLKRAAIRQRVEELLTTVGLSEHGAKYPAQLSGGQQQRVALARALAPSPGLLLLDEPLSALDAKVRIHLRNEMKALQRELGITTVMVTHDQDEALSMADRIVVMNHGVIAQVGTPMEVYRAPQSAFVADFIGTMNLADGQIRAPGMVSCSTVELAFEHGQLPVGTDVTIAIRPEEIELVTDAAPSTGNLVAACLDSLEFLGAFYRCSFHDARQMRLRADVSDSLVRTLELAPGKHYTLRLPVHHLRVYQKEGGHGEHRA